MILKETDYWAVLTKPVSKSKKDFWRMSFWCFESTWHTGSHIIGGIFRTEKEAQEYLESWAGYDHNTHKHMKVIPIKISL